MSRLAEAARIPAALLGIALAVFAQTRLGGKPSLLPSILYASSIIVAVAALRGAGTGRFARAEAAVPAETQESMRLAWVLLALAVMAMAG
ncbi:MAG: hypothetical protein ACM3QS_05180, partial [Bacteroidota bacterium]